MKIIKKYDQYIKGNLTEDELDSLTREVVKDHFEKEELQNRWKRILQEEHDVHDSTAQSKKLFSLKNSNRLLKIVLSAAASISLLLLFWFTNQSLSVPTYEKLLSEELNKPFIEDIGRKGKVEELKLQAAASYNERDYASAIKYFEQLNKIEETIDWSFYMGLCQLYQKQSDLAIQSFTAILNHPNKKYNIETNWYLGMAYIMDKDFKLAKEHLEFVVNQSNDEMAWKVKDAKALLNALAEKE